MEKPKMDYAKLSPAKMITYIFENCADDEKIVVGYIKALDAKEVDGKKTQNIRAAKGFFYNKFKDAFEWENVPRRNKMTAADMLSSLKAKYNL